MITFIHRNHADLEIQSWAVTQVLTTEKVINRRPYVAKSVRYRFGVEQ